jgi:polysaccharide export outer membrane protein
MKTKLRIFAVAALAAGALALALAYAADQAGIMVSGADVLVVRFHGADGKVARTLRVQPNGATAWEGDANAKADTLSLWLDHGGVVSPLGGGAAVESALSDPNEFVIGPGDVLDINAWKKPDLSRQVPVRPDGRISLPLLGDVNAAGRTANQLRDELNAGFGRFVNSPEVTVTVAQVHSYQVFVQGQVGHPGAYPMTGRTTLVQAIGLAGGFTQFAATRSIAIMRQTTAGSQRLEVNYDRIVAGKTPDVPLRPGDTIVVP